MAEPIVFEICFPSHISRAPVCRPGQTIAGTVVLKLNTELQASYLQLRFFGVERVRRTPVSVRTEVSEKKQQQTTMSQKMVMDKEFFHRELILWGERKIGSQRTLASNTLHRFHFSFTMPYVNMPTPRQTPDIEISYSLEAVLAAQVMDQTKGEKVLRDVHRTGAKCFHFEPVIQQRISHGLAASAPLESIVALKDVTAAGAGGNSGSGSSSSSGSASGGGVVGGNSSPNNNHSSSLPASFATNGKTHMNLHVFHPTPAYLPGETVELLLLAPSSKKITNAAFQLRENVRCRKSSAPIIDESDVPTLWKYSVDLTPPQEISFSKLSKSSISQDIGLLGRYLFTSHASLPVVLPLPSDLPKQLDAVSVNTSATVGIQLAHAPSSGKSISDSSTVSVRSQGNSRIKSDEGLAIANLPSSSSLSSSSDGQPPKTTATPLSPLAETQEIGPNSSSDTLDSPTGNSLASGGRGNTISRANSATGLLPGVRLSSHHSSSSSSASMSSSSDSSASLADAVGSGLASVRNRKGSLGGIHTQSLYPSPNVGYLSSSSAAASHHQSSSCAPAVVGVSMTASAASASIGGTTGHRMSKSLGVSEMMDDNISDRSSISETLSIHYQQQHQHQHQQQPKPNLGSNLVSLTRGATSYGSSGAFGQSKANNNNNNNNVLLKNNRLSITPVPLGGLLTKGSYRFAKISFTLPPVSEMSPVSSVFLDYEYAVDIAMTLGGSFGTTKKTIGRLPLKIVTIRTASKSESTDSPGNTCTLDNNGGHTAVYPDTSNNSGKSLRDSLSVLNLSIGHSSDDKDKASLGLHAGGSTPNPLLHNGSPANTLTDFHFETTSKHNTDLGSSSIDEGGYPCLLTFLQNGERIPMPELEAINIGSNMM
ncbi:hypothetical protein LPJ64_005050 [Coemansia asiatica]|uniref:Arrestin-like N-terminal domain-containing protein n=1 Tax=Coemansia asiatica TaxID=1052880 RepID=A0A9W7XHY3_9FUNG|nr:hypothetical protein LPJ64_005050 [Coemansia asiatica]